MSFTFYIPQNITVHLGVPDDASAPNVTVPFVQYIKNVASSEIYPTWPEDAIRANIYAQVTYALNRIFTAHYRAPLTLPTPRNTTSPMFTAEIFLKTSADWLTDFLTITSSAKETWTPSLPDTATAQPAPVPAAFLSGERWSLPTKAIASTTFSLIITVTTSPLSPTHRLPI